MAEPLARFDGAAVWATLDPKHQASIGAAALELVALWALEERVFEDRPQLDPRIVRVERAIGDDTFIDMLRQSVVDAYPQDGRWEAADGVTPLVPSEIGSICRTCGCSFNDPCHPPCGWVEPDLCSACKGAADA
ncbi:hypothetical protein [Inquilinus sp.]|jgi:hypothetical protein|uniref:hypothetical protein n=1 Tax=Inquilinus sp. TaxID=1932117 RepID=UPI003783F5FC